MARDKQHVFSARTTEQGLKALNETKGRLKLSWDEMVIEAVSAHYNLDREMMSLPRKEKPVKEPQPTEQQSPEETVNETAPIEEVTKGRSATLIKEESAKKQGKKSKKGAQ